MTNRRHITLVFYAANLVLGLGLPLFGVTIGDLANRFGIPLASAGQLQTLMSVGAVTAALVAGPLYDRLNAHFLLPFGSGLVAASMFALQLASARLVGFIGAVLLGLGFGVMLLGLNVVITRLNPGQAAGPLNTMNFLYGVGAIVSPQLVTLGVLLGDLRLSYAIAGGAMALITIPFALVDVSPPPPATHAQGGPRLPIAALLPFLALFFCNMSVEVSYNTWIVTQAQTAARAPLPVANTAASIFWIGYTASRAVAAYLSRGVRPSRLLAGAIGIMIGGYALMLSVPSSQAVLIASSFVIGVGTGPLFPTNIALTGEAFPHALGQATGILSAVGNLGPMTIPLLQGRIGGGRDGGMVLLLGLSVVMLGAALYVGRRSPALVREEVAPDGAVVPETSEP